MNTAGGTADKQRFDTETKLCNLVSSRAVNMCPKTMAFIVYPLYINSIRDSLSNEPQGVSHIHLNRNT